MDAAVQRQNGGGGNNDGDEASKKFHFAGPFHSRDPTQPAPTFPALGDDALTHRDPCKTYECRNGGRCITSEDARVSIPKCIYYSHSLMNLF